MNYKQLKQGFTLIELLVVVLIIGILAAVALPQYQVAVAKSRASTYWPLLRAIKDAQEARRLATGSYEQDVDKLDIKMPANCSLSSTGGNAGHMWTCGKDVFISNSTENNMKIVFARYCPGNNANHNSCYPKQDFIFGIYFDDVYREGADANRIPGGTYCDGRTNLGKKVCKTMQVDVVI